MVKNLFKKGSLLAVGAMLSFSMLTTAITSIVTSQPVEAAAQCADHADAVNIVYKGVDCSTQADTVSKVKSVYNANKSGHSASPSVKKDYTDIKTVYNWAGASQGLIDSMNTGNTKFGTVYKDGRVVVGNETVATDAWVTARFNGSGFKHVTGNVYARKTSTNFTHNSAKVLVVYKDGQVAFVVMVDCGNAIKVTPKPPKPTPKNLVCNTLIFNSNGSDNKSFVFTAKATPTNTTITKYDFNFGDGQTKTVTTSANTAKIDHAYAKAGNYTATVKVSSKDKADVTSPDCAVKVTIAPPEAALSCDQLTFTKQGKSYAFTAKATPKNTEITNYDFDFGDGQKKSVPTSANTANATHTYDKSGTYTAVVTVSSKDKKNVTSAKCAVKITIEQEMCEVPGKEHLPKDSPECKETPVLTCDQLLISPNGENKLSYSFVVKATAKHTTIENYTVDFGDGSAPYIGAESAINHTYAKAGNYTVTASVNGKEIKNVTSAACKGNVTIEQDFCKVPGKAHLPVDSPECKETPGIPETPETPETPEKGVPTELPQTGPASIIGLISGFTIAGTAAHRLFGSRLFGRK